MPYPALFCRARPPQCAGDPDEKCGDAAQHPVVPPLNLSSLHAEPCRSWNSLGLGPLADVCRELWSAIIRPPRRAPAVAELDRIYLYAVTRSHGSCFYERQDIQLRNSRGQLLECSHFVPMEVCASRRPCVVYLHGSSSNRLEVKHVLEYLLRYDVTVFCFDFAGSGQSEGDYVSLGYYEEQDLRVVLDHLRRSECVSSIGLWGWSMGAVAAILRASEDPLLSACVLDSPFADFCTVAEELVVARVPVMPKVLVDVALKLVLDEARSRHRGFDPNELRPIACVHRAAIPAMFGVARDDEVTPPHHTQELHDKWGGDKSIYTFDGGHGSRRPQWFSQTAAWFLWKSFKQGPAWPAEETSVFPVFGSPEVFRKIRKKLKEGKRPTPYVVEPRGLKDEAAPPKAFTAEPQGLKDTTPSPLIFSC